MTAPSLPPERWKSEEGERDSDGERRYEKEKRERAKGRRWGGRMPHLHTFLRDIARHCGRWNKALSSVLFPFVAQVRGINKNVSRCWAARDCGRKVIDVGWRTHPDFPTSHNGSQSIRRAWFQCSTVKTSAVVKHSKSSDVSCAINHFLMDAPY